MKPNPQPQPERCFPVSPHLQPDALLPEFIAQNTTTMDITQNPALFERACQLTAEAYGPLGNPRLSLGVQDVFDAVSKDYYEQPGRSKTVATLITHPQTGCIEITGLLRVVFGAEGGNQPGTQPIDAMNFMVPSQGWPHKRQGISECEIAELSRLVIIDKFRTPEMRGAGLHVALCRRLYAAGVDLVRSKASKILYGITPVHRRKLAAQAGITFIPIESRLKTEDSFAARVFENFSPYWFESSPVLGFFPDAPLRP